jgi:hypothetical protein
VNRRTSAGQPYTELDCVGNVRHVHSDGNDDSTPHRDLGGASYSAFGKLLRGTDAGALNGGVPLFGWQGKRVLSALQPNLYDSRARVWSADLGAFLQPDEYVFLTPSGTLWSWPGQNPFRYRDPSGRDAEEWFLRNADSLQGGAEALAGAALTIATGGLAGELLGFGSLDATLGALGASATAGGAAVVTSDAATAAAPIVAKVVETECENEPAAAEDVIAQIAQGKSMQAAIQALNEAGASQAQAVNALGQVVANASKDLIQGAVAGDPSSVALAGVQLASGGLTPVILVAADGTATYGSGVANFVNGVLEISDFVPK